MAALVDSKRKWERPFWAVGVGSVVALGTFGLLYVGLRPPSPPASVPIEEIFSAGKDAGGYRFVQRGYVLCPRGAGIDPTRKAIHDGTFVVLWLGTPEGEFVERTWGEVLSVDPEDPNRIFVVLRGEMIPTGLRMLEGTRHGFHLGQAFWMTKDCVPEAYDELGDPRAFFLCGAHLLGTHEAAPATPPLAPQQLVGWAVEMLLASRAGRGTAWQVPVSAEIISVGPTGDIPRVRVTAIGSHELADHPPTGHSVELGAEVDVPWDCILRYTPP